MSRKPRLVLPGVPMHIVQRGNNQTACFFDRADYQVYLALLASSSDKFECPVHAYVLMTNHVHILATPPTIDALPALMKRVGQNYTQYINRRHARYGTLWQGRYRSCLVADARYFLTCHRYIELNPTRAGMTLHPEEYEWSSYRANALGVSSMLIKPHSFYLDLALHKDEREECYRRLFDEAMSDEVASDIRRATNGNLAVGSPGRLDSVSEDLGRAVTRQSPGRKPH